jgi:methionine synthase II (cobalamin-independent)
VWDVAQALGEALRLHVADVRRRVPGAARIVVQLDEPSLPAVLAGRIGTSSGLSSYGAVDGQEAERILRQVLHAAAGDGTVAGVHCCASQPPVDLLRRSGVDFVSIDLTLLTTDADLDDEIGTALDAGLGLLAGCVPSTDVERLTERTASAPLRTVLHRIGLDDARWLDQVAITPTCGLAEASPDWARRALTWCREVGRIVRDDEQGREEGERD